MSAPLGLACRSSNRICGSKSVKLVCWQLGGTDAQSSAGLSWCFCASAKSAGASPHQPDLLSAVQLTESAGEAVLLVSQLTNRVCKLPYNCRENRNYLLKTQLEIVETTTNIAEKYSELVPLTLVMIGK